MDLLVDWSQREKDQWDVKTGWKKVSTLKQKEKKNNCLKSRGNIKWAATHVMRIWEEEEREIGVENIFKRQ